MTFEQLLAAPQQLLLKCISGSRAYNLHTPASDTDIKGIFILPQKELYGFDPVEQLSDAAHDEVYFEVGRFMDLLTKNNPNILELLGTPGRNILFRHPLMELIRPEDFLSRLCRDTFAGYAQAQIRKATGMNKKMNNPLDKQRKTILDFCYVIEGNNTVPLKEWLHKHDYSQEECGLVRLSHFRDGYLLFHQEQVTGSGKLKGIISGPAANDVQLNAVPKGIPALAVMSFNKDGYSVYCREYNEYWQWVEKRNEERYQNTLSHGKSYDAKNMMHTFRLLTMAEEIALHKKIIVWRNDRDFLLRIRNGEFEYIDLLKMAEDRMGRIEDLYRRSDLPELPDMQKAENILVQVRETFYAR